jgi:hypothetical protein
LLIPKVKVWHPLQTLEGRAAKFPKEEIAGRGWARAVAKVRKAGKRKCGYAIF